jgi:hypothetical protein
MPETNHSIRSIAAAATVTLAAAFATNAEAQVSTPDGYRYISTYFDGNRAPGQSGLSIAGSDDGFHWNRINIPNFRPQVGPWQNFADPSFDRGPDGTYHMVWTTGNDGFGYATSQDLVNWGNERFIEIPRIGPFQGESMLFTWAPEITYIPDEERFDIIFSQANESFDPNKRTVADFNGYRVSTTDFQTLTTPVRLFGDNPPIRDIDAVVHPTDDGYVMFTKRENVIPDVSPKQKDGIYVYQSPNRDGPWTKVSGRLPGNIANSEGPSPVDIRGKTIVYYDQTSGSNNGSKLKAVRTDDFENFQDISELMYGPNNFRHGTMRQVDFSMPGQGSITRTYWTDLPGADVDDLADSGRLDTPTGQDKLQLLESVDWEDDSEWRGLDDDYAQRIEGYFTAPETGEYTFFVSGDDSVRLSLNLDGEAVDGATIIAELTSATDFREWDKFASQRSQSLTLEAGERYYLELLHKESGGDDHFSVGWLRPGQSGNAPTGLVPGYVLTPIPEPAAAAALAPLAGILLRRSRTVRR